MEGLGLNTFFLVFNAMLNLHVHCLHRSLWYLLCWSHGEPCKGQKSSNLSGKHQSVTLWFTPRAVWVMRGVAVSTSSAPGAPLPTQLILGAQFLPSSASFAQNPSFKWFSCFTAFLVWLSICCGSRGIPHPGFVFDGRPSGPSFCWRNKYLTSGFWAPTAPDEISGELHPLQVSEPI